jgi:hypothetical protein
MTRLQPREYTIRATGCVRTVCGIQSLMNVYLLALWALTHLSEQASLNYRYPSVLTVVLLKTQY